MEPTTFTSSDGFRFALTAISQRLTYGGMLEGLPTVEGNQRLLDQLAATDIDHSEPPLLVLAATETSIDWDHEKPYPFGTPSALPSVQVDATFSCTQQVNPDAARYPGYSCLRVIWFQAAWALPISNEVVAQIGAFRWAEHAKDVEY